MQPLSRRCLAEGLGTFGFVLIGCGMALAKFFPGMHGDTLALPLAHAAAYGLFVTAMLSISGGHLNPAVTLGFLTTRRIDGRTAGAYIASQLAGAVLAVLLLKLAFPAGVTRNTTMGTPALGGSFGFGEGILLEALLTFILMSAVYGTIVAQDQPRFGGFGVGVALLGITLVGGPTSGGVVNPARAFGPALISNTWIGQAIWWIGPIIGAVVAAQLWERVILKK